MYSLHILANFTTILQITNEVGPEGHKLLWFLVVVVVIILAGVIFQLKRKSKFNFSLRKSKVALTLKKDRLYYPRFLELTVNNKGNKEVLLDCPLLVLKGFWYSRKFKLKGTNNKPIYPLFLMRNQSHNLTIDLHRFYGFDRTLKRLPKAIVVIREVNGHKLGSKKVMLRKTLFNN